MRKCSSIAGDGDIGDDDDDVSNQVHLIKETILMMVMMMMIKGKLSSAKVVFDRILRNESHHTVQ